MSPPTPQHSLIHSMVPCLREASAGEELGTVPEVLDFAATADETFEPLFIFLRRSMSSTALRVEQAVRHTHG